MGARVLVTGGTGFVGRRLLSMLAGHEVLCVSRNPARLPQQAGVTPLAADLAIPDGDWARQIAAFRPEWCFHLAWDGLPDYSLDRCRINLEASLRLLDVLTRAEVRKVIVAGTCWEYGAVSGAVSEQTTPGPRGVFAAAKQALLTMLESVAHEGPLEYRWARVFFVYGPGQRPTSLLPSLRSAFSQGRAPQVRQPGALQDFVHVDDVAGALLALAACEGPSGVFNIGSGQATSVAHVVNRAAEFFGAAPPFPVPPPGDGFWADMTKTTTSTGWRPRIAIDEGIRRTLADVAEAA